MSLRIATRGSALALCQTNWVAARLRELSPSTEVEVVPMTTHGDRAGERPLTEIGGKGVFVKELEEAMLDGRADAAVHSLKDLPAELPEGLSLAAFPQREDPRDALCLPSGAPRAEDRGVPLKEGARVGNSSLRRRAQLLDLRPDLHVEPIRGNVDTRLRKMDEGRFDGLVLAAAALRRLELTSRIEHLFDPETFVPAPGQGALAIECRADSPWREMIARLDLPDIRLCVELERFVMARLSGGCLAPVGVHATVHGDDVRIGAMVAMPDGSRRIHERAAAARGRAHSAAAELAERILAAGGREILAEVRAAA